MQLTMSQPSPVREFDQADISVFRNEIYPSGRPAILRGLGAALHPVQLAKESTQGFADFLKETVGPSQVKVLTGKSGAGSTFFFEDDIHSFNFERGEMLFTDFVDALTEGSEDSPMMFMEATRLAELCPELARAVQLPIAPQGVPPLAWIGNRTGVQTHFDYKQNIAYVVSGRRRFTLFPPDQTPNLYMAPLERSPSFAPVSMVRIDDPDFEKFPRFREAQKHALVAELEPGDALFIPYMWWHRVEALGKLNLLVNYWWNEYDILGEPMPAMLHAMLVIRDLPGPMRDAWKTMFQTFVFKDHGDPMEHIAPQDRGGLGELDGRQRAELWNVLWSQLGEFLQRMRSGGGRP